MSIRNKRNSITSDNGALDLEIEIEIDSDAFNKAFHCQNGTADFIQDSESRDAIKSDFNKI